ncbi:MAG: hypothetical protein DSZ11_00145 [Sulfurovum sp.]|nr:MAG: hypothetical protein DSZ11_00145 [Sulfurovum sp.]
MIADIERLPHQAPIRFVTEVIKDGENDAISMVEFNEKPTLSSIVESAAQNVIFITSLYRVYDGGVLTGMKHILLHQTLEKGIYRIESKISAQLDSFCIFTFQLFQNEKVMVEGEFNVVMKKRKSKI